MVEGPLSFHLSRCLYGYRCMYVLMYYVSRRTDVGFSSTSNENAMTDFRHYYVLRIFHVYKCTVNENTNKSAYWYTSQKSSIPDFAKPGIVAEICPQDLSILHICPLIGS